jgi:hypothetical protein
MQFGMLLLQLICIITRLLKSNQMSLSQPRTSDSFRMLGMANNTDYKFVIFIGLGTNRPIHPLPPNMFMRQIINS